jgi:hypothetical protein
MAAHCLYEPGYIFWTVFAIAVHDDYRVDLLAGAGIDKTDRYRPLVPQIGAQGDKFKRDNASIVHEVEGANARLEAGPVIDDD